MSDTEDSESGKNNLPPMELCIDDEETLHSSNHEDSPAEDDIPLEIQELFAEKLSQQIRDQFEITDISPTITKRQKIPKIPSKLRLLKGFNSPLTDLSAFTIPSSPCLDNRPKPMILKSRRIDDIDGSLTRADRIRLAVTNLDAIKTETSQWRERCNERHVYRYKCKKSKLYLIEPRNEFTEERNRNNWSESKIARPGCGGDKKTKKRPRHYN